MAYSYLYIRLTFRFARTADLPGGGLQSYMRSSSWVGGVDSCVAWSHGLFVAILPAKVGVLRSTKMRFWLRNYRGLSGLLLGIGGIGPVGRTIGD